MENQVLGFQRVYQIYSSLEGQIGVTKVEFLVFCIVSIKILIKKYKIY